MSKPLSITESNKMIDFQAFFKKYAYFIGIAAFGIWMLFFDSNSLLSQRKLNKEIESLKRQKEFLQKEFGREHYYFKRENEDIFIIEYDTIK